MFVVKQPVLTEKTFNGIKKRVYVFLVSPKARKPAIKREIEYIFNVKVDKINTLQEPWKTKRIGRNVGRLPRNKRAIVTLAEGYGITIYPQEEAKTEEVSKSVSSAPLTEDKEEVAESTTKEGGEGSNE